jgi:hypothetical protein
MTTNRPSILFKIPGAARALADQATVVAIFGPVGLPCPFLSRAKYGMMFPPVRMFSGYYVNSV